MFMYIHVPLYHLFPDTQNRVKRQDNNNIYIKNTSFYVLFKKTQIWQSIQGRTHEFVQGGLRLFSP